VTGRKSGEIKLTHGTARESARQVIYALRRHDTLLEFHEFDNITARMRDHLAHRGEGSADDVVVQGRGKNSLRLAGAPYSVNKAIRGRFSGTPDQFAQ
jgi:hypothetical protein